MGSDLTRATQMFKLGLKMLLVGAVLYYFVILLFLPSIKKIGKALIPERNPANPVYGLLDPLEFVEKPINTQTPKYSLNTTDGKLPKKLPDRMKVYKFKSSEFSFLSDTEADRKRQRKAKKRIGKTRRNDKR